MYLSLCLNFFHLLARKPTFEKFATYSNKFFHNFHLSKSSFTCPRLLASELVWRQKNGLISIFVPKKIVQFQLKWNMNFDVKREAIEKVEWSGDIHKRVSVTNSGCSDIQINSFIIFTCPNPVLLVPGFWQVS
jgi:hypothetical protein